MTEIDRTRDNIQLAELESSKPIRDPKNSDIAALFSDRQLNIHVESDTNEAEGKHLWVVDGLCALAAVYVAYKSGNLTQLHETQVQIATKDIAAEHLVAATIPQPSGEIVDAASGVPVSIDWKTSDDRMAFEQKAKISAAAGEAKQILDQFPISHERAWYTYVEAYRSALRASTRFGEQINIGNRAGEVLVGKGYTFRNVGLSPLNELIIDGVPEALLIQPSLDGGGVEMGKDGCLLAGSNIYRGGSPWDYSEDSRMITLASDDMGILFLACPYGEHDRFLALETTGKTIFQREREP